jgi:molybdopterin converting factor small subunit
MDVDLYLYASLANYLPGGPGRRHADVSLKDGSDVRELVNIFKIPEKEVKLVFINGVKKNLDTRLGQNDRVGLFPPVGGG